MAEPSPAPAPPEDPGGWRETIDTWLPAIVAVILVRLFVFEPFQIPSGSMVPTLRIGDYVVVTKPSYGLWIPFKSIGIPFTEIGLTNDNIELIDWGDPERGDVIVFHYPENEAITYIKRVVAVAGDRIRVVDNQVMLNGERLPHRAMGPFDDIDDRCATRKARQWVTEAPRSDAGPVRYSVLTNDGRPGFLGNHREVTVPEGHVFVMGDNRDHSQDSRAWGFVREEQIKGKAHFVWLSWDSCAPLARTLRFDRMFTSLYDQTALPDPAPRQPVSGAK